MRIATDALISPDETGMDQYVSCIVGEAVKSNEEARRIADAATGPFYCLQEPQYP